MDTQLSEIKRKKAFHPDDYFEDGKRQIDLILAWKKYPEGKNQDGGPIDPEKFEKRVAQREALFLEVNKFTDGINVSDRFSVTIFDHQRSNIVKSSFMSPTSELCLFIFFSWKGLESRENHGATM